MLYSAADSDNERSDGGPVYSGRSAVKGKSVAVREPVDSDADATEA